MRNLKSILSIIMVIAMLCSCFSMAGTASAAKIEPQATESSLPNNVEDGLILHAFCWGFSEIEANLDAIAAAGYTAIQTSPVQQPKDKNNSTDISGQWWKLYQPASLSIGDNSWLGTKAELTSLCAKAEEKGIKIICDVVTNHLGADSGDGENFALAEEVATYEPTIWNGNGAVRDNPYLHSFTMSTDDSSIQRVVQYQLSGCPDLNTGNQYVQDSVCDLLKDLINCGVDGFRFDAAKHIETADDGEYASDYWSTVIGYAKSLKPDIFVYGEILNSPGAGRSYSSYTKEGLRITDNKASAQLRAGVTGHNATGAAVASYNVGEASDAVLWAESHDTFLGTSENTSGISNQDIVKTWAIVGSRKDATALFFPRTDRMSMGGTPVDTTYKSVAVSEVNRFHNQCVGQSETLGSSDNFAYVQRGQMGMVIVNTNGTNASVNISGISLANGEYTDMVTGNKFTVANGTVTGTIGSTGVAVVSKGSLTPTATADKENQSFAENTLTVKLSLNNATSGTFQLENGEPIEFTEPTTIRIGRDYNPGETITLTLTATNGVQSTTTVYKYNKLQPPTSGVYITVPTSVFNASRWVAPYYCYIFDENTDASSKKVYQNAVWPGEAMKYDSELDCYYIHVQNNSCLQTVAGSTVAPVASNFDLSKSSNTYVIFSDSSANNGSTSSGYQYPLDGSAFKLPLQGTSHTLSEMYRFGNRGWATTTDVPSESSGAAIEVSKEGIVDTKQKIGDINLDDEILINDATALQKYLVELGDISCATGIADVDKNGNINIFDVTYIQRYIAKMDNSAFVGEAYEGSTTPTIPTNPTNPTDSTTPTTPTTPVETYTIYVKTSLSWIEDYGSSLFAYDTSTGDSYYMSRDTSVTTTNVFSAEVPKTCTSVLFYRATAPVEDPATASDAYNKFSVTFTETNNCYNWTSWSDATSSASGTVGPYSANEETPTDGLQRLYVDNSSSNWGDIYVYGWGNGLVTTQTYPMTYLTGSIWYIDLPQAIPDGTECFLLKNTFGTGSNDWDKQTPNLTINLPNNCYNIGTQTWYQYN